MYQNPYEEMTLMHELMERLKSGDATLNEDETIASRNTNDGQDDNNDAGSTPYTTQDQMMSSICETCKQQFGADFANIKNPMLYHTADGDVTLSGEIPVMNNAKFQFRYKDSSGNGCYLWTEPIQLTDESLRILSVMHGVFKNWQKELSTSEDIKPMSYHNQEALNEARTPQRKVSRLFRRGDDIELLRDNTYYNEKRR